MSARGVIAARRRLRDQNAAINKQLRSTQATLNSNRGLLDWQNEKIQQLDRWAAELIETVGRHAIAVGEPAEFAPIVSGDFRLPVMDFSRYDFHERECFFVEVMRLLEVQAIRSDFAREMHCTVTLSDCTTRYTISESALRNMSVKQLERVIAPQIVKHLVAQLKGRKPS